MSKTPNEIQKYLESNFGNVTSTAWYLNLHKTATTKNITIADWNALVLKAAIASNDTDTLRKALESSLETISDIQKSAIIDCIKLPDNDINENVYYRLMKGFLLRGKSMCSASSVHIVEELPESGAPIIVGQADLAIMPEFTLYVKDNVAGGFVTYEIADKYRIEEGWYRAGDIFPKLGYSYFGNTYSVDDTPNDDNFRVLFTYELYYYKRGHWRPLTQIGTSGTATGAEIFNYSANIASGEYSHAEGFGTEATRNSSHVEGIGTVSNSDAQHVQGRYNELYEPPFGKENAHYAHVVGNGAPNARSNAHTLDWAGNAWYAGDVFVGGAGQHSTDAPSQKLVTQGELAAVEDMLRASNQALTFSTYIDMIDNLNSASKDMYRVGNSILIADIEASDAWIFSRASDRVEYNYVDNATFEKALSAEGGVQVGYYVLCKLETQKIDLTDYVTNDALDEKGYALESDIPNVPDWALKESPPTYSPEDVGLSNVVDTGDSDTPIEGGETKFTTGGAFTALAKKVDTTTTVNGKALSENITLEPKDIGLGNVANERQYSVSNPPPYPVKSVNNKTGNVALTVKDIADAVAVGDSIQSLKNDAGYMTSDDISKTYAKSEDVTKTLQNYVNSTDFTNYTTATDGALASVAQSVSSLNTNYSTLSDNFVKHTQASASTITNLSQDVSAVKESYTTTATLAANAKTAAEEAKTAASAASTAAAEAKAIADTKLDKTGYITAGLKTMEGESLGENATAEGTENRAVGKASHAEGKLTVAYSQYSHTEGYKTYAGIDAEETDLPETGDLRGGAHAEGCQTVSKAQAAHAEGQQTNATAWAAHAEGKATWAIAEASHTEGHYTIAASDNQHVQGKYNIQDTDDNYAHIVGNGTPTTRSNAHTLDWQGNAWFAGDVYAGGEVLIDEKSKAPIYPDTNKLAKMSDIPTKVSELTNDMNYLTESPSLEGLATETYVNTTVANLVNSAPETLDTLGELATALNNHEDAYDALLETVGKKANDSDLAKVAKSGSYNDLADPPTIPTVPTVVSEFDNDAGYVTADALNKSLESYAKNDKLAEKVDKTTKINGKTLSANITLSATDVKALPDTTPIVTPDGKTLITNDGKTSVHGIYPYEKNTPIGFFVGSQADYDNLADKNNLFALIQDDNDAVEFDDLKKSIYTEGLAYTLNDDGEGYHCYGRGTAKSPYIIIPPYHNGKPVTEITTIAFKEDTSLKDIVIPDTVTVLGNSAFEKCTNLRSVTFGKGISNIGFSTFADCTSLAEVVLPARCEYLGNYAFYGCTSLKPMCIPNSVKWVGSNTFRNCPNLTVYVALYTDTTYWDDGWDLNVRVMKDTSSITVGTAALALEAEYAKYVKPDVISCSWDAELMGEDIVITPDAPLIDGMYLMYCNIAETREVCVASFGHTVGMAADNLAEPVPPSAYFTITLSRGTAKFRAFYANKYDGKTYVGKDVFRIYCVDAPNDLRITYVDLRRIV